MRGTKGGRQRPKSCPGAAEGNATRSGQEFFEAGRKILMDFEAGRTGTPTLRPQGTLGMDPSKAVHTIGNFNL